MTRYSVLGFCAGVVATLVSYSATAVDKPTFTKDVLPIVQENCQECHRPKGDETFGMIAPMSFMNYKEVRPWAKAIAKQVAARTMPPWHASDQHDGVFKNQRTLSDADIHTLVRWVETGATRGAPSDAPAPRVFPKSDGWSIGKPDLVVPFPEAYFVNDNVEDLYHDVSVTLTKEQLPEDRWVRAMDFRPGSEVVHHIVIYLGSRNQQFRNAEGGGGMFGGQGPGTNATVFPDGYGRFLPAGSTLTFNMHYHKEPGQGTGVWDKSALGFVFQDKPVTHPVHWDLTSSYNIAIPPGDSDWRLKWSKRFSRDSTLLALFPHMHLRGKAARYTAYYPDGSSEILLDVPKYDFNWQTTYIYNEPKTVPAGTRIDFQFAFDNSKERAEWAGFNANRSVRYGLPTTDEMANAFIDWTPTKAGVK
jgi:hypothetical protein